MFFLHLFCPFVNKCVCCVVYVNICEHFIFSKNKYVNVSGSSFALGGRNLTCINKGTNRFKGRMMFLKFEEKNGCCLISLLFKKPLHKNDFKYLKAFLHDLLIYSWIVKLWWLEKHPQWGCSINIGIYILTLDKYSSFK